jgi:hypothetical protein
MEHRAGWVPSISCLHTRRMLPKPFGLDGRSSLHRRCGSSLVSRLPVVTPVRRSARVRDGSYTLAATYSLYGEILNSTDRSDDRGEDWRGIRETAPMCGLGYRNRVTIPGRLHVTRRPDLSPGSH